MKNIFIFVLLIMLTNEAISSNIYNKQEVTISTYHSTQNEISKETLLQLYRDGKFIKNSSRIIIERNNINPVFVAVKLPNEWSNGNYKLVIEDCFIDKINYFGDSASWNESKIVSLLIPFNKRDIQFPFATFSLNKTSKNESIYFFSFQNYYHNSVVPIKIFSEHAFQNYLFKSYLIWGGYLGVLIITLFITLWMIFLNKEYNIVFVFFAIFSNLIWVLFNNGLGFQYVWPDLPEIMQTGRFIAYHFSILFLYLCFEIFIHQKAQVNFQKYIKPFFVSTMILSIFFGLNPFRLNNGSAWFSIYFYFANFLQLSILLYIINCLIKEIKTKNINAWFYLLSFFIVFISHICLILIKYKLIEPIEWVFYLNYVGFFIQVISLMVVLLVQYVLQKRDYTKNLYLAKESERQRIAIDMHDDIGASLSTIKIISEIELKKNEATISKASIEKIHQKSIQINQKLKEIIWTLQATNNTVESLVTYILEYGNSYFAEAQINFIRELHTEIPAIEMDGIKRRHVLLIMKELFQNIVKHAESANVFFKMEIISKELHIWVNDDGKGMPQNYVRGNGINNIYTRMKLMNGIVNLSCNQNGVSYYLIIPL